MENTKIKKPKIAIIIVNWNGIQDTLDCLKSLGNVDYPNFDIVVVDNGSNDKNEAEKIKSQFPNIKMIKSHENLGFSGGNNLGIKFALKQKADYILLLNNDTIVESDFLSKILKYTQDNHDVGMVSPLIYVYSQPKKIWFSYGKLYLFFGNIQASAQEQDFDKDKIWFISGCCMFVKSEVFQKIGLFDDRFFAYFEDTDLCVRAKRAGYKIGIAERAKILHKVSQSSGGVFSPIYLYYMTRNNWLFAQKNLYFYHWISFILFYFFYRVFLQGLKILIKSNKGKIRSFQAIFRGIFDAWRGKYGKAKI